MSLHRDTFDDIGFYTTGISSCRCERCQQRFPTHSRLRTHMQRKHSGRSLICTTCPSSFVTSIELNEHIGSRHPKERCPFCDKVFLGVSLAKHIQNIHQKRFGVICEMCGKGSTNRAAHRISHYEKEHSDASRVQCDICGVW